MAQKIVAVRTGRFFAERAARADIPGAIVLLRRFGAGKAPLPGDGVDAPESEGDLVLADTPMRAQDT